MPKIYLVTDDILLGHTISRALMNKLGYELHLSSELPNAPDKLDADLFIYEAPIADTLQARLPLIRKIAQEMPLIALFKYSHHTAIQALIQAGAVDYVTLPSSIERLQTTIKNTLTLYNMRKTLERWSQDHSGMHSMGARHLPHPSRAIELMDQNGAPKKLSHLEEEIIQMALRFHQGCLARTAKQLGIGRTTLYRKLRNYTEPKAIEIQQEVAVQY